MKFLRKIFSRFTLFAIILLLEVGLFITALILFKNGRGLLSEIFQVLTFAVEIIMFFIIVTRKDLPEYKVPWFALLVFIPLIGVFVFIFFGNHGLNRVDAEVHKQITEKIDQFEPEEHKIEMDNKYIGINNYLKNVTGMQGWEGNKVSYYECGEKFFPDFINKLKEAKEYIFMEFFIVEYGKEWDQIHDVLVERAKAGVEVRVLYDDIGCAQTLKNNYYKTLRKEGIKANKFNKFRPFLSGAFNYRSHRKIAVVDHKYGFTGGMNLADEYANDIVRFGYWKDSMIRIEGPAIYNLTKLFLTNWDAADESFSDYGKYLSYKYKKEGDSFVFPFGDGPAPAYYDLIGEQTFINLFNAARDRLIISSPYLIPTYNLVNALKNAALRGVRVDLIVPGIPDKKMVYMLAKSYFAELNKADVNIHIYEKGFNHQKSILCDEKIAFVGTINLDYRSLVHHYECGAIVYKGEIIEEIKEDMYKMSESTPVVPKDFKQKFFARLLCYVLDIFAVLF